MAKIVEYRDISLDDLVIGKGQARTQNPGAEIEDLAKSIEVQGLLQPIVVCPANETSKWEILTGQRRFLAHKYLKRETISAAILDGRIGEYEAKAISITENLIRRKLVGVDLRNAITYLYNHYGSIQDVVTATGLPKTQVQDNVKYPRLLPELKQMVDDGGVDINTAIKAQDAATDDGGKPDSNLAVRLATEMQQMTGIQQKKASKTIKENPGQSIDDTIENAKTGSKVTQIITTVTQDTHAAIQKFAKEESTTQDEATSILIEEGLTERGFLGN